MAITYHIQSIPGVRPQAFLSRLEVKSLLRGRSRILGGIPGGNRDYKRQQTSSKFTTTDTNNQPEAKKRAGYSLWH